jgi:ribosomal peptide maturation radical SAM protein 1
MSGLSIMLVSPPLCEPAVPNLAIELLASIARRHGHRAATLHAALQQPMLFRDDMIHGMGAQACFSPAYFNLEINSYAEEVVDAIYYDFSQRDRVISDARESIVEKFFFGFLEAERCLDRILELIPHREYDIIAFSVGFDSQKLPAAALAKRLRIRGEEATIVVGGTGTDDEMGAALLERFPEFDLVVQGEADQSWPRLLQHLSKRDDISSVPGCVYRANSAVVSVPESPPSQEFLESGVPDYAAFLHQHSTSRYANSQLCLLVETSRGCWWGKKHHCTFCGIKSVDFEYRSREAQGAVNVLTELYDRYQPDLLYCTDAIVPASYHATAWQELAEARQQGRDWRIFYETKSNMKRKEIARMAAAGITRVQPGIESLSTNSLKLMNKGANALQQISYLKWAHAYGVTVNYGLISGMPGESAADLDEMASRTDLLRHLPPPADVNRLALHRFSPHFRDPTLYGIENVRPFRTQELIFQCDSERVKRLCYQLDFTVADQCSDEYEQARDRLVQQVLIWREDFLAGAGLWIRPESNVRVIGRNSSALALDIEVITDPVEVLVLDECAELRAPRRIAADHQLPIDSVLRALDRLVERGLVLVENGYALTLAIPPDLDPLTDADWSSEDRITLPLIKR